MGPYVNAVCHQIFFPLWFSLFLILCLHFTFYWLCSFVSFCFISFIFLSLVSFLSYFVLFCFVLSCFVPFCLSCLVFVYFVCLLFASSLVLFCSVWFVLSSFVLFCLLFFPFHLLIFCQKKKMKAKAIYDLMIHKTNINWQRACIHVLNTNVSHALDKG